MSMPLADVVQTEYRNPHASLPLFVSTLVLCNTSEEVIAEHIRENSSKALPWLKQAAPHEKIAVMIGGGASVRDFVPHIKKLQANGATVFAMNAASRWARFQGIRVDGQVIVDAKQETASLVDPDAEVHYIASQCHPDTVAAAPNPVLWHLEIGDVEQYFPEARKKRGGYVLLGGGASVGNSALCLAYSQGYRKLYIFGYDSCHSADDESHAYAQPMNQFIPTVKVKWAGKEFKASVAMKAQAEKFQLTAQSLQQEGVEIRVFGEGLLQTMWNTSKEILSEAEKYQLMWQYDAYRQFAPGEQLVDLFVSVAQPSGLILDLGCGTGRGSLKLAEKGYSVLLTDFTDNCRDNEALSLPFFKWDLSEKIPVRANYGFCTDVMEHIPPVDVSKVLGNIAEACEKTFFAICTQADHCGGYIGHPLHLTVQPHGWWKTELSKHFDVCWEKEHEDYALFLVSRKIPA